MNCKPGILARTVGLSPMVERPNDRIVKLADQPAVNGYWTLEEPVEFVVRVACSVTGGPLTPGVHVYWPGDKLVAYAFHDDHLRPIEGLEGDDETLAWAGKPKTLEEA